MRMLRTYNMLVSYLVDSYLVTDFEIHVLRQFLILSKTSGSVAHDSVS